MRRLARRRACRQACLARRSWRLSSLRGGLGEDRPLARGTLSAHQGGGGGGNGDLVGLGLGSSLHPRRGGGGGGLGGLAELQGLGHILGALRTLIRILVEQGVDGAHQIRGQVRAGLLQGDEVAIELPVQGAHGAVGLEGPAARGGQVEHGTQGVQVGAGIGADAIVDFGRGVAGGAQHAGTLGAAAVAQPREAEVGEHRLAPGSDHHVARGDVPVQQAGVVGFGQHLGQPHPQPAQGIGVQRALLGDLLGQGLARVEGQAQGPGARQIVQLVGHQGAGVAQPRRGHHLAA